MDFDLCSASAARLRALTCLGPRSHSTVDHFFLLVAAAAAVAKVTTLMLSMRVLQLVRAKEPRDHAPVAVTLRPSVLHPPRAVHP